MRLSGGPRRPPGPARELQGDIQGAGKDIDSRSIKFIMKDDIYIYICIYIYIYMKFAFVWRRRDERPTRLRAASAAEHC